MEKDVLEAIQDVAIYPEFPEELGLQRYIPQKERDSYDAEDFAGPDRSFPITSQAQLDAAAKLIGHADDPATVKKKAIAIAKRKGFKLPESWQEEDGDKKEERSEASEYHALYMPVTHLSRRDADEWIVEGQATAEVPDSYGTIFTYEASKRAFQNWYNKYANVREMHGKKAVGKGIAVTYDDANKRILVRTRVSKAEPGTWTKFHEGVLNGFSVGTGTNYKMGRMTYQGKSYPAIIDYELAELSYVDNPSCPGSDARIIARADGMLDTIIDDTDPEPEIPPEATTQEPLQTVETPELERAGARVSAETKGSMHKAIGGVLKGAKSMMDACNCETCQKGSSMIDPDNDGDVDWMGIDDPDHDPTGMDGDMERMQAILERSQNPILQRHNAILARYAQFDTNYAEIQKQLEELKTIKEQLSQLGEIKSVLERVATASTLEEVRAEMSAMEGRVKKIEDSPAPGGPVLNGARNPYEKSNPYMPQQAPNDKKQIERETLQRLYSQGAFQTPEDQIAAASLMLRPMTGWE